jgi:hypothetical protein
MKAENTGFDDGIGKSMGRTAHLLFLGVIILFSGCMPQPIVHKRVKPRLQKSKDSVAQLGYTSVTSPGTERDAEVQPAIFLLPSFDERSEQNVAAEALSQIGPPAVKNLKSDLHSRDPRIRREAVGVLVRMGPDAKDAVPDLIVLLDDEDEATRKLAARALGRIGPEAAPAIPALKRMLMEPTSVPPRP